MITPPESEGIARVDEDRVVAVHPRPAGEARPDSGAVANDGLALHPPLEQAADDAFMDEVISHPKVALSGQLRHAGGGAGAAWRAVDRLVAIEDGVAAMGARVPRCAGPLDVAHAADRCILGMHDLDRIAHQLADDRAEAQDIARRQRFQTAKVLLGVDDGVEVPAIGDIHGKLAEPRHVDHNAFRREVRGHVMNAHAIHEAALPPVFGDHPARRGIERERSFDARRDETIFQRHRHRPDRAMTAHGQGARDLDEEDTDIAVVAGRRVEDGAAHHVVAARLEHQGAANPVVIGDEVLAPLAHRGAPQQRAAARDQPHGIAAGMAVDALESVELVDRHGLILRQVIAQCAARVVRAEPSAPL
jgi:hypothetical protein